MAGRLDGKVAVITGGASGMGRATVLRFLAEGAKVVAADMNEATGKALVRDADSSSLRFVRADVAVESDVENMTSAAVESFGRLDVVFNNAGVGGAFGAVTDMHADDWDYTFAVLCRGVFLGTKHGARAMKAAGNGGSIINTASVAGLSGGAGPLAYSAAKAAVINFTRAVSIELATDLIRVNAICPGAIATPLLALGGDVEELAKNLAAAQPLPVAGRGEDIAGVAVFLASDDAAFVTGASLVVDGGLTAAGPGLAKRTGRESPLAGLTGVSRGSTGEEAFTVYEN